MCTEHRENWHSKHWLWKQLYHVRFWRNIVPWSRPQTFDWSRKTNSFGWVRVRLCLFVSFCWAGNVQLVLKAFSLKSSRLPRLKRLMLDSGDALLSLDIRVCPEKHVALMQEWRPWISEFPHTVPQRPRTAFSISARVVTRWVGLQRWIVSWSRQNNNTFTLWKATANTWMVKHHKTESSRNVCALAGMNPPCCLRLLHFQLQFPTLRAFSFTWCLVAVRAFDVRMLRMVLYNNEAQAFSNCNSKSFSVLVFLTKTCVDPTCS